MLFARQFERGMRYNVMQPDSLPSAYVNVKLHGTKCLSSQITPVGRLCLWWFSMNSYFGSDWQPSSSRGTVILWVIILPLQTLLGGVFPMSKTEDSKVPGLISFPEANHLSHLSAICKTQGLAQGTQGSVQLQPSHPDAHKSRSDDTTEAFIRIK